MAEVNIIKSPNHKCESSNSQLGKVSYINSHVYNNYNALVEQDGYDGYYDDEDEEKIPPEDIIIPCLCGSEILASCDCDRRVENILSGRGTPKHVISKVKCQCTSKSFKDYDSDGKSSGRSKVKSKKTNRTASIFDMLKSKISKSKAAVKESVLNLSNILGSNTSVHMPSRGHPNDTERTWNINSPSQRSVAKRIGARRESINSFRNLKFHSVNLKAKLENERCKKRAKEEKNSKVSRISSDGEPIHKLQDIVSVLTLRISSFEKALNHNAVSLRSINEKVCKISDVLTATVPEREEASSISLGNKNNVESRDKLTQTVKDLNKKLSDLEYVVYQKLVLTYTAEPDFHEDSKEKVEEESIEKEIMHETYSHHYANEEENEEDAANEEPHGKEPKTKQSKHEPNNDEGMVETERDLSEKLHNIDRRMDSLEIQFKECMSKNQINDLKSVLSCIKCKCQEGEKSGKCVKFCEESLCGCSKQDCGGELCKTKQSKVHISNRRSKSEVVDTIHSKKNLRAATVESVASKQRSKSATVESIASKQHFKSGIIDSVASKPHTKSSHMHHNESRKTLANYPTSLISTKPVYSQEVPSNGNLSIEPEVTESQGFQTDHAVEVIAESVSHSKNKCSPQCGEYMNSINKLLQKVAKLECALRNAVDENDIRQLPVSRTNNASTRSVLKTRRTSYDSNPMTFPNSSRTEEIHKTDPSQVLATNKTPSHDFTNTDNDPDISCKIVVSALESLIDKLSILEDRIGNISKKISVTSATSVGSQMKDLRPEVSKSMPIRPMSVPGLVGSYGASAMSRGKCTCSTAYAKSRQSITAQSYMSGAPTRDFAARNPSVASTRSKPPAPVAVGESSSRGTCCWCCSTKKKPKETKKTSPAKQPAAKQPDVLEKYDTGSVTYVDYQTDEVQVNGVEPSHLSIRQKSQMSTRSAVGPKCSCGRPLVKSGTSVSQAIPSRIQSRLSTELVNQSKISSGLASKTDTESINSKLAMAGSKIDPHVFNSIDKIINELQKQKIDLGDLKEMVSDCVKMLKSLNLPNKNHTELVYNVGGGDFQRKISKEAVYPLKGSDFSTFRQRELYGVPHELMLSKIPRDGTKLGFLEKMFNKKKKAIQTTYEKPIRYSIAAGPSGMITRGTETADDLKSVEKSEKGTSTRKEKKRCCKKGKKEKTVEISSTNSSKKHKKRKKATCLWF